jgi:hypothetical protein
LNAKLAGVATPLVTDGVWGVRTQEAVGQFIGTLDGRGYAVLGVDPTAGRVLLSPPLEDALVSVTIGMPRVVPPAPAAGGAGMAIGLSVVATLGLYFATRSRSGPKPRGVRGLGVTWQQIEVGDEVVLPRGLVPGFGAKAIRYGVAARVDEKIQTATGDKFYRVSWVDEKGRQRTGSVAARSLEVQVPQPPRYARTRYGAPRRF